MRRLQLIELHDYPWFPPTWRSILTESMACFAQVLNPFRPIMEKLLEALGRLKADSIVDLGSGSSGPLLTLLRRMEDGQRTPITITMTDKFPNLPSFRLAAARAGGGIAFVDRPVDALDVPREFSGFRTMFTSFHHFPPDQARKILQDAVSKSEGIGIFEYTEPSLAWIVTLLVSPVLIWITAPFFIRPFSLRKAFWIYVLPLPLIITIWDGFVSSLRTYSPRDMEELVAGIDGQGYLWDIGRAGSALGYRITYLVGLPAPAGKSKPQLDPNVA